MNWSRSVTLAAAALLTTAAPAFSWDVTVEGPDVFGTHKALGGTRSAGKTLVIQCDNEEQLHLAYLIPIKEFDEVEPRQATFLVQVDTDEPKHLDAVLRGWNDNNAAVVVSGRTAELIEVILMMGTAKKQVNVGVDIEGARASASFSARGSTATIRKIDATCGLSAIID